MKYFINIVPDGPNAGNKTIARIEEDGILWWLGDGEQDAGYLAWLAEGNTPEQWEA